MNPVMLVAAAYQVADFSQDTWWLSLLKAIFIVVFLIVSVIMALWVERRGLGRMQTRPGPNVAGPLGLFQALADAEAAMVHADRRFEPVIPAGARAIRRRAWGQAVEQTLAGL